MTRIKVSEGDIFQVHFGGRHIGFGVVARRKPRSIALLGYLFNIRQVKLPHQAGASVVVMAKPEEAIVKARMFDHRLVDGEWPIVGRVERWSRSDWPLPIFMLQDALRPELASLVSYSEDNPLLETGRRYVSSSVQGFEHDGLVGCEGAAFILAKRQEDPTFHRC